MCGLTWRGKSMSLCFDNESLEGIMNTLSLWYDVDVFFQTASLKQLILPGIWDVTRKFPIFLMQYRSDSGEILGERKDDYRDGIKE